MPDVARILNPSAAHYWVAELAGAGAAAEPAEAVAEAAPTPEAAPSPSAPEQASGGISPMIWIAGLIAVVVIGLLIFS